MKSLIKLNLGLVVFFTLITQSSFAQSQGAGNGVVAPCSEKQKAQTKEIYQLLKTQPICLANIYDGTTNERLWSEILKPNDPDGLTRFTIKHDEFYLTVLEEQKNQKTHYDMLLGVFTNAGQVATATSSGSLDLEFMDQGTQQSVQCLKDLPNPFPVAVMVELFSIEKNRHYSVSCWPSTR